MNLNFKIMEVYANGQFTARLESEMPDTLKDILKCDKNTSVVVMGVYELDWNDEYAYPYVTSITLHNGPQSVNLTDWLTVKSIGNLDLQLMEYTPKFYRVWADEFEAKCETYH